MVFLYIGHRAFLVPLNPHSQIEKEHKAAYADRSSVNRCSSVARVPLTCPHLLTIPWILVDDEGILQRVSGPRSLTNPKTWKKNPSVNEREVLITRLNTSKKPFVGMTFLVCRHRGSIAAGCNTFGICLVVNLPYTLHGCD